MNPFVWVAGAVAVVVSAIVAVVANEEATKAKNEPEKERIRRFMQANDAEGLFKWMDDFKKQKEEDDKQKLRDQGIDRIAVSVLVVGVVLLAFLMGTKV